MPHNIVEIEGVVGKTVEKITVTNESDFHTVTVRFCDETAIHFRLRSHMDIEPELYDWRTGDGELLRAYDVIYEHEE